MNIVNKFRARVSRKRKTDPRNKRGASINFQINTDADVAFVFVKNQSRRIYLYLRQASRRYCPVFQ